MQTKRVGYFFGLLLLLTVFTNSAEASSDTTVSFGGGGVEVSLAYPKEAQPNSTITHEIMITTNVPNILHNFTVIIKASVNSSWVEIRSAQDTTGPSLPTGYNLTISLPQDADGKLQCYIFVETSSIKDLSIKFYSTLVSKPTFSEMRVLYVEMVTNYTILQEEYETLKGEYNATLTNYTALVNEFSETSSQYEEQISAYQNELEKYDDYDTIKDSYTAKIKEFNDLQTNYEELNITLNELQANYTQLVTDYEDLKDDYTILKNDSKDLVASLDKSNTDLSATTFVMIIFLIAVVILISFILYLKRKGEEPYIVIRKETVSLKSDEGKGTDSNVSSNASVTNF